MENGFLTAKGRGCGKGVKEKHNSVLDDSSTTSKRVKEGIDSPSTVVSNEEPNSRDSLGGKHNAESAANLNLVTPSDMTSTSVKDVNSNNTNVDQFRLATYARAMVELQLNVELKDTIVVVVPKFVELGDVLKNLKNPRQVVRGVKVGPKVGFKQTKQVYRCVSQKNSASISGKKKQDGSSRQESQNKVDYAPVDSDSDSDVEVAYDETAQFMASGGANDASLYEDEDYENYDTYDIEGLTKQELAFDDMMDINLCGRGRR
ncbi:hypothetical protein Tco_0613225 [Tanacetum coccineum]